jgi:acyl-CoA thioesterase FadM
MSEQLYFQDYMPDKVCFGCGADNPEGLHIQSFWDGAEAVCFWQPQAAYQGWPGITCGGIIATLIDCHCMATAMATAIRNEKRPLGSEPSYRFATGSLHIRYLQPTPMDRVLELRAQVIEIKNDRKYTLACDLLVKGVKTVEAEVIAFLVYRSDQPELAPPHFKERKPFAPGINSKR